MKIYRYILNNDGYIIDVETSYPKKIDKKLLLNDAIDDGKFGYNLIDKYGNYQFVLQEYEKEIENGFDHTIEIRKKPVLKRMMPTEEQKQSYYQRRVIQEIKKQYSPDDEMKILYRGTPEEVEAHEVYIAECKSKIKAEIAEDIKGL